MEEIADCDHSYGQTIPAFVDDGSYEVWEVEQEEEDQVEVAEDVAQEVEVVPSNGFLDSWWNHDM